MYLIAAGSSSSSIAELLIGPDVAHDTKNPIQSPLQLES